MNRLMISSFKIVAFAALLSSAALRAEPSTQPAAAATTRPATPATTQPTTQPTTQSSAPRLICLFGVSPADVGLAGPADPLIAGVGLNFALKDDEIDVNAPSTAFGVDQGFQAQQVLAKVELNAPKANERANLNVSVSKDLSDSAAVQILKAKSEVHFRSFNGAHILNSEKLKQSAVLAPQNDPKKIVGACGELSVSQLNELAKSLAD